MKKLGNNIFGSKLFGQISPEQKRLYIFAPTVIVITVTVLYFALFSETTAMAQESNGGIDLMLPDAQTKELSNEKQEVFDDLEDYKNGIKQDKKNDFEVVLDDPLGTKPTVKEGEKQLMTVEKQIELIEQKQKPIYNGGTYDSNKVAERPLTKQEKEAQYRDDLLKAREARLARSQDYSIPEERSAVDAFKKDNALEFKASIYRDQFILPGDRVTIILDEPLNYKGNVFKKNTFLYANANIQGSRVMLNVTNIDHVTISLVAKDIQDGNLGMHSDRAGELWREFQAETQSNGVNNVSGEVAQNVDVPLLGTAIRSFGQFFRKKKYRAKDKILLVNNDKLILTTSTN